MDQLAAMQVCSCGLEAGLQWTVTRKLTITLIALQLMQKLRSQPIDANKTDVSDAQLAVNLHLVASIRKLNLPLPPHIVH